MQIANRPATTHPPIGRRHSVPRSEGAYVEFDYPQPQGRRRRLSLLNLSPAGLCFALPFDEMSGISRSTTLLEVIVQVGGCTIRGHVQVSHVTRESEARVLCGGRFQPSTRFDRLQMLKAIDELQSAKNV